jgi:hypothetical protein
MITNAVDESRASAAYDIQGLGDELNEDIARRIGRASNDFESL